MQISNLGQSYMFLTATADLYVKKIVAASTSNLSSFELSIGYFNPNGPLANQAQLVVTPYAFSNVNYFNYLGGVYESVLPKSILIPVNCQLVMAINNIGNAQNTTAPTVDIILSIE